MGRSPPPSAKDTKGRFMSEKHATWTRTRIGRDRVHWVAYDDRQGAEDRIILGQGYAPSLREADLAARAALAECGVYGGRRVPTGPGRVARPPRDKTAARSGGSASASPPRREYLYTRHEGERDGDQRVAAHLIVAKTATKVRVTRPSCGPDQLGTDDENWDGVTSVIALDRAPLERDGSAYAKSYPGPEFYVSREKALGDTGWDRGKALRVLGIQAPCTRNDIKEAYRLRSLEVHPDRGGQPGDFRAVEDAYRRLLGEAEGTS